MKNKCSYGHDLLSNIMIKKAHDPLIKPLTLLINQSLSSGVLPNDLKISRVKPLFKRGNAVPFRITGQFLFCHHCRRFMNMRFLNNYQHTWKEIVYFTVINMDLDRVIQLNLPR